MWLLVILALSGPTNMQGQVLEEYETGPKCKAELTRIQAEMASAYKGDESYSLVCLKVPDKQV